MSSASNNPQSEISGTEYSRCSVSKHLIVFKCTASSIVYRAARRVKNHTPLLWVDGNRLNTTLRVADLAYCKPISIWSGMIDGNWFRVGDAIVATAITAILLYSKQGMEPPGGETRLQQWINALKDPDQAAYFGMATALPSAAISYSVMLWYMCNGRPEQCVQLATGLLGTGFGIYSFRKEARRVKNYRASSQTQLGEERFLQRLKDFVVKRVGVGIGALSTASQIPEGLHVLSENSYDGWMMLAKTAAAFSLLAGGQAWMEIQWKRSDKLCRNARIAMMESSDEARKLLALAKEEKICYWRRAVVVAQTPNRYPYCQLLPRATGFAIA